MVMSTNPEQFLISAVLTASDHVTPSARGITRKQFHSYPDEWVWIENYISKHRRCPSPAAFKRKFPGFKIRKDANDVEHFCEEVKSSHATAELTSAINDALADIEDGHISDAVKGLHKASLRIESESQGEYDDSDIIDNWRDTYDEVMRRVGRRKDHGQAGIPTGFPTLDERTGGPQPGQFWIIAARLGQGKTWSLARMAVAAAFSGYKIQYDALEGSRAEIAMRIHTFASSEYGKQVFKNTDLTMGQNFSPREYKEFLMGLRNDVKGKMFIADTSKGQISNLSIAAQIERNHPDAVYLDYLTLMDATDGREDLRQSMVRLSTGIKHNAQMYQIPIIAAAQLNRKAAERRDLSDPEDLAESDSFGRDADAVVTMKQLSKHVIAMKMSKWRHGRDGYVWYTKFLPNTGHFEEVTYDQAMDSIAEDKDAEVEEDFSFKPRKKGSYKETQERKHKSSKLSGNKSSGSAKKSPAQKRVVKRSR